MIAPEEAIPFLFPAMAVMHRKPSSLYAECHDGVDNIIVILLQSFDGLLP